MLFTSSLMLFRVAIKMEPMGLETVDTLQVCIFLCDSYSVFCLHSLAVVYIIL